ncbi:MAG: thioesterase family protein [Planctomycetota bacterium]
MLRIDRRAPPPIVIGQRQGGFRVAVHRTEIRVRYADTDRAGVVYHANYLVFFEVGRTEMMRELGCPYSALEARGFVMPVIESRLAFRAPARYDDRLTVESELLEVERVRFKIGTRVIHAETDKVLAEGWLRLACTGPDGRPTPIPEDARRLMLDDIFRKDA